MGRVRVAIGQIGVAVGALNENADLLVHAMQHADEMGADLIVFPELVIAGYPPEDLLLRPAFIEDVQVAAQRVIDASGEAVSIFGSCDITRHNVAVICKSGRLLGQCQKRSLPNYAVFDEARYFTPGETFQNSFVIAGVTVGVVICEDLWVTPSPIDDAVRDGAECVVVLNASPFFAGRIRDRIELVRRRAIDFGVSIVYVNLVGAQDELVFDGGSFVVDADGDLIYQAAQFAEELAVVEIEVTTREPTRTPRVINVSSESRSRASLETVAQRQSMSRLEETYAALVMGTRDYVLKNEFVGVVLGLSGGIDSSLVATIAVDAIGAENVHGVAMPSRYSSDHSQSDAQKLAENLGIKMRTIPIIDAHELFSEKLQTVLGSFHGLPDENLQSRLRGITLMAISNHNGWLVLATGNKSEVAVGYSTLYGDSVGGLAVIKDVVKTDVYALCRWRNAQAEQVGLTPPIPESVIVKPPSAELREGQRDDQTLPPYDILDPIIVGYIEDDLSPSAIADVLVAKGLLDEPNARATTQRVIQLIDDAEFKRRQSPIGIRVTPRAFGRDYRVPITNRYSG